MKPERAAPEALRRRGIRAATELAPHPEFRVRNAGAQLARLFGDELQQRLARRAATRKENAA